MCRSQYRLRATIVTVGGSAFSSMRLCARGAPEAPHAPSYEHLLAFLFLSSGENGAATRRGRNRLYRAAPPSHAYFLRRRGNADVGSGDRSQWDIHSGLLGSEAAT